MASVKESVFLEKYLTPISVLLGAAIIGGALILSDGRGPVSSETESAVSLAGMHKIASSVGIDTDRIEELLEKNALAYQSAIDADVAEGQAFGIDGTPGTIIGTQLIVGAQPLAVVLDAINGKPVPLMPGQQASKVDIKDVKLDTGPFVGRADAPTTMAVWFDFQCGFCKRFEAEVLSEIQRTLVADGQVRIVYKDYQFLGPASNEAALYSRAVWEAYPDRWHDWFSKMLQQ